jgi:small subunit ribosomal protein S20
MGLDGLFYVILTAVHSHSLANSPQAKKRARQSEKRRAHNASQRSTVRTYIKRVLGAVEAKDAETAGGALVQALPMIDKMVTKGIMHKNQAARHKSRLTKKVKALSSAD